LPEALLFSLSLLNEIKEDNTTSDISFDHINIIIKILGKYKKLEKSIEIFNEWASIITPNTKTLNIILVNCIKNENYLLLNKILNEIINS
jgi:hypothetical protein